VTAPNVGDSRFRRYPAHVIVGQADATVALAVQAQVRVMSGAFGPQQPFRRQQERMRREARAQREREMVARLHSRTTTSQRT